MNTTTTPRQPFTPRWLSTLVAETTSVVSRLCNTAALLLTVVFFTGQYETYAQIRIPGIPDIPSVFPKGDKVPNPFAREESWNPTNVVMPALTGDFDADTKAMKLASQADQTVWEYRIALNQMRKGNYENAGKLLDDALQRVQASYGKSKEAAKARNIARKEAVKPFIGEPYERSMANYYRGIIYWMSNNVESARASFKMAQFEDSDAEKSKYQSDYVSFDYMYGLASFHLGDAIWENWYQNSLTHTNGQEEFVAPPVYSKSNNVIAFIEYGRGPTKFSAGKHNSELHFTGGETEVHRVRIASEGVTLTVAPYDNLTFQAITRGGRVMDHILKAKSQFKTASGTVGDAALLGSIGAAAAGADSRVAYGFLALGVVSKFFSHITKPDCDTRCWNNLPQCLSFAAFALPGGEHRLQIDFLDNSLQPIPRFTRVVTVQVRPEQECTVLFISDTVN